MKTLRTFEKFEQEGKKFVIIAEHDDPYLLAVDIDLYDEILNEYGSLETMYGKIGHDAEAEEYYDRILDSEQIDSDYIIPY